MQKEGEFANCVFCVSPGGLSVLVDGPDDLRKAMDGDCFDDCDTTGLPDQSGVYCGSIEVWFEPGYVDGHPAPGESDWEFRLRDVRRITVVS